MIQTTVKYIADDFKLFKKSIKVGLFWGQCVSKCLFSLQKFLDRMNVIPAAVLTTHKHW